MVIAMTSTKNGRRACAEKDMKHGRERELIDQHTWLTSLPELPIDEVFMLNEDYTKDCHQPKVNLTIGVYRASDGNPAPFPSVTAAERLLHEKNDLFRHEYLPASGDPEFLRLARELIFGPDVCSESRTCSVQTISGTGAVHIAAEMFSQFSKPRKVWISNPTWNNHHHIFRSVGIPISIYPYLDANGQQLDMPAMLSSLDNDAQAGDLLLLQACAHNPSGQDPNQAQWKQIAQLCQQKQLSVLFDCAYQGFASGDPVKDVWAIRHFSQSMPNNLMAVAQSFSKSFGLYGQRTGALHVVLPEDQARQKDLLRKHLVYIIRSEFSLAPRFGSSLVKTVLGDPELYRQWLSDLDTVHTRLRSVRTGLHKHLLQLRTPGSWDYLIQQTGMFSYTGFDRSQISQLQKEFHIYLLGSGRASISGLHEGNLHFVAEAIHHVVSSKQV